MAEFDFPASPTNGQQYVANGVTYTWNGYAWTGGAPVISASIPWDSVTGKPTEFPTNWSLVAGKPATFPSDWDTMVNKPATFPPANHTHPVAQISDATAIGQNLVTAATQQAGRNAIGAITSDDNARVAVTQSDLLIGSRRKLNFINGSNATWTITEDAANEKINLRLDSAGGSGGGGIAEAPIDGTSYGRRDAAWDHVVSHNNDIIDGGNF